MPEDWDDILQQVSLSPWSIFIRAIALSPDGKRLASSHSNYNVPGLPKFYIELWQSHTGTHLSRIIIPSLAIAMCWAEGGKYLLFFAEDGKTYRHDFLTEHPVFVNIYALKSVPYKPPSMSPSGVVAIVLPIPCESVPPPDDRQYEVRVWYSVQGKTLQLWNPMINLSSIAISQDYRQVAVVADDKVKLLDTKTKSISHLTMPISRLVEFRAHAPLAFSLDGNRLFMINDGLLSFPFSKGPTGLYIRHRTPHT